MSCGFSRIGELSRRQNNPVQTPGPHTSSTSSRDFCWIRCELLEGTRSSTMLEPLHLQGDAQESAQVWCCKHVHSEHAFCSELLRCLCNLSKERYLLVTCFMSCKSVRRIATSKQRSSSKADPHTAEAFFECGFCARFLLCTREVLLCCFPEEHASALPSVYERAFLALPLRQTKK